MSALALLLVALAPCLALSASPSHPDTFAPLILWSNSGVVGNGRVSQVLYEVYGTESLVDSLVHGASGAPDENSNKVMKSGTDHLNAVIIYAGSQIDAASLRKASSSAKLGALLENAGSSMVIPYSTLGGSLLEKSLEASLSSVNLKTVGCSGAAESDDLGTAVARAIGDSGELQIVLVCGSASGDSSLDAELETVEDIQEAVEASELDYVMIYASQVSAGGGKGRSLLQNEDATTAGTTTLNYVGFGPYTECGILCQTQVRWLEGMLAILILALASLSGLTCLIVLNTPTRFEVPKDGAAQ